MDRRTLSFLYLLVAPLLARGSDSLPSPEPPFYEDKARGWFWHEVKPEPFPREEATPRTAPPATIPKQTPVPPLIPPQPSSPVAQPNQEPAPLSAEWFRKNLEKYRDTAIDNPTPENVAAYYYLQRVMMDKASRFTDVARHVVQSDPLLDANTRRPLATYAVHEAAQQSVSATEEVLTTIAQHAGILFFFRSDCRYCHIQAPLLAILEKRFSFKVYAVSLDGLPMPGGLYQDFHPDQGQAMALGVQSTPALYLMKPPNDLLPLSQGALSLDDLTGRIILAGKQAGLVGDEAFESTRGQRPVPTLIPATTAINPAVLQDPTALIEALRSSAVQPAYTNSATTWSP